VLERTGVSLSDFHAQDLLSRVEIHLMTQGKVSASEPESPFGIDQSRNLSQQGRDWLLGADRSFSIYTVNDDWLGKKLTRITANYDPDWDNRETFLFMRKEMVADGKVTGDAEEKLVEIFNSSSDLKPKESYPLDSFGKMVGRLVGTRNSKRVRIPKTAHVREETPFQALHMPDDEGCYNITMEEAHGMKTFFRGNHGIDGDRGEMNFWWSENEDLWVFWTYWVRWIVKFK